VPPGGKTVRLNSRPLGSTDLALSEIGLGCQSLGGGMFHGDRREALALVAHALDSGVTYFDTADHYSLGRSETLLGEALQRVRDRIVISTKVGTLYTPAAKLLLASRPAMRAFSRWLKPAKQWLDYYRSTQRRGDFSAAYLQSAVRASLRRLRTDYIDLLLLHKPPVEDLTSGRLDEVIGWLAKSGEVRYVGVSCESVDDAIACLDVPGIAALQVTVNLIDQAAAERLLPEAHARGIGVIARNPRAAGLLTGAHGDVTAETYARDRAAFEASRSDARRFDFLADSRRSLAQAAIRFVLQLPGISATTPRANSVSELDEAIRAAALPALSRSEFHRIEAAGRQAGVDVRKYRYRSSQTGEGR